MGHFSGLCGRLIVANLFVSHARTFPIQRSGRSSFWFGFSCRIAFVFSGAKKFFTIGEAKSFSKVFVVDAASDSVIVAAPSDELMDDVDGTGKTSSAVNFNGWCKVKSQPSVGIIVSPVVGVDSLLYWSPPNESIYIEREQSEIVHGTSNFMKIAWKITRIFLRNFIVRVAEILHLK